MIGKQLQLLRVYLGLTQDDVARDTGVSKFTIVNIENNKTQPQLRNIAKIEQTYNVKLDSIELIFQPCYNE